MAIKVSLLGFSKSTEKAMTAFIRSGRSHYLALSENNTETQAAIIDMDNIHLQKYSTNSQRFNIPLICLSTKNTGDPRHIWIKKPITHKKIIDAGKKLTEMTPLPPPCTSHTKHQNKQSALKSKMLTPPVFYNKESSLQGVFNKVFDLSKNQNQAYALHCQGKRIVVNAPEGLVSFSMDRTILRALCRFNLEKENTKIAPVKRGERPETTSMGIQHFQWEITLACSRGRVDVDISLNQPYQLIQWPNITRWQTPEHAMAISALWAKEPATPADICKQLDLDSHDVFTFFMAAIATGLLKSGTRTNNIIEFKSIHGARKILVNFFNKLKRA